MSMEYLADSEFEKRVLGSKRLVVVLFSLERDADLKMSRIIGRIAGERGNEAEFLVVKLSESPGCAKRYGISVAPMVLLFAGGNAVGQLVGLHPKDVISQQINRVLARPVDELPILGVKEMKVRVGATGEWSMAVTSGLVVGAVFALALHYVRGVLAFMVLAFAIGLFILNDNFRFSWSQKVLAIGLMLAVGLFGPDFLKWAYAK